MGALEDKISSLLETSQSVFKDCILENGAIVAADTDKPFFSKNVDNYRYVWARDASFIMYASLLLGNDVRENFAYWLLDRAEGFEKRGLLNRRFATHGMAAFRSGHQYQPDQAGALLWIMTTSPTLSSDTVKNVIYSTANRLCDTWEENHFNLETHDVWEMFSTSSRPKDSFIYALVMCGFGLQQAYKAYGDEAWLKTSQQMKSVIENSGQTYYGRLSGNKDDIVDGSLLGAFWPCDLLENNTKLSKTLEEIGSQLMTEDGILRFIGDVYSGKVERMQFEEKAAGSWPLLTCWYAIALNKFGRADEARSLFEQLTQRLPDKYIPEQLLDGKARSVSPLGWSHAMYIIAAHHLGYLPTETAK